MRLRCLHCGYEFDGNIEKDELGWHSSCPECECSFDVDCSMRIWFRVGMEANVTFDEMERLKKRDDDLMIKIIERADLSGETYILGKNNGGLSDYDNPDEEINFLY